MRLVTRSGFLRFPALTAEQPIFYPICNEEYAIELAQQIAREEGGAFVTRFQVQSRFLSRYEPHIVGQRHHEEYWIPREELEEFNEAIVGPIAVLREFQPSSVLEARRRWFENYVEEIDTTSVIAGPAGGPYPCPCCGHRTLVERGAFETCPVCFWEDDGQDEADADKIRGGPNGSLSLRAARANFEQVGASDARNLGLVRKPKPEERP
jgi:hypothetical protein